MIEHTVDARNMSCPQPLVKAKKALEGMKAGERLRILINNKTSRDNLIRFLSGNGMSPSLSEEGGEYSIEVEKMSGSLAISDTVGYCEPDLSRNGPVIVINHHGMGSGSEELGRVLLQACIFTLKEISPLPSAILCYNAGVLVAAEGSPTVPALKELASRGVNLLLCGTCVDYYELKDKISIGTISNMHEILQLISNSKRVMTL
jgi:selenium metabolism protein YedF